MSNLLQRSTLRRPQLLAILSAAGIATAATTGILVSQATDSTPASAALKSSVVDMAIPGDAGTPPTDAQSAAPSETTPPAPAPPPPSDKVLSFDFQYQPNYYYCGPAAVRIALTAHGVNLSQDDLANQLGTTVNGTDSAAETTRVLNSAIGTSFYQTSSIPGEVATPAEMDRLQADAAHAISNGYAVVANIIGGATDSAGVWHDFPGGHYIAIVGYSDDGRSLQVADSSGMYGSSTYWMSTIDMANWIGTRGYSA
jgi:hypothetical protein